MSISLHLFASGRALEADISPRGYELVAYGTTDNFNYPEKQLGTVLQTLQRWPLDRGELQPGPHSQRKGPRCNNCKTLTPTKFSPDTKR
ncbi:MAG: hypothetical protein JWP83_5321 [Mycobacterium sp.]|nr:hypothetical protein [Mycobacterium sp.]